MLSLAALAEGETVFVNAGRLRMKESDRWSTTAALLRALGGPVAELAESLSVRGMSPLRAARWTACERPSHRDGGGAWPRAAAAALL